MQGKRRLLWRVSKYFLLIGLLGYSYYILHIQIRIDVPERDVEEKFETDLRIMHYNRHAATQDELSYVLSCLSLNPQLEQRPLHGWGLDHEAALKASQDENISRFCFENDIIFFSDVVSDVRPFLLQSNCDQTTFVVHITNRFDFMIPDPKEYHALFRKSIRFRNKFIVVSNNYADALYLESKMQIPAWHPIIIRPNGHISIPEDEVVRNSSVKNEVAFLPSSDGATLAFYEMVNTTKSIQMKKLTHPGYGGPSTLSDFKGIIMLPYQVSVMKTVQNLRAGVIVFLPSVEYFNHLVRELKISALLNIVPSELRDQWDDFSLYCEYYSDELVDNFFFFRSIDHLEEMILSDSLDLKNMRLRNRLSGDRFRRLNIRSWQSTLNKLGVQTNNICL